MIHKSIVFLKISSTRNEEKKIIRVQITKMMLLFIVDDAARMWCLYEFDGLGIFS